MCIAVESTTAKMVTHVVHKQMANTAAVPCPK